MNILQKKFLYTVVYVEYDCDLFKRKIFFEKIYRGYLVLHTLNNM